MTHADVSLQEGLNEQMRLCFNEQSLPAHDADDETDQMAPSPCSRVPPDALSICDVLWSQYEPLNCRCDEMITAMLQLINRCIDRGKSHVEFSPSRHPRRRVVGDSSGTTAVNAPESSWGFSNVTAKCE